MALGKVKWHPGIDVFLKVIAVGLSLGYGPVMIWWNATGNYTDWYCRAPNSRRCKMLRSMNAYMYGSGVLLIVCG
jgi:hypothetical protein